MKRVDRKVWRLDKAPISRAEQAFEQALAEQTIASVLQTALGGMQTQA